ncbi:hypothetical protein BD626DRAFT_49321 [Schizophyllum amplum]|uniref:Uncharacterized protein n=1 Tax=Schizophyllum amplum TaxID=97359 RepID=A0A550BUK5_9AGAR|nr:hypothetical protein BD626DRAFT_575984 [Auriculariopsis ampla]TRM62456.1 hypothetical protein BD626DRAFT_49321 [Auriculariopsis ampla]
MSTLTMTEEPQPPQTPPKRKRERRRSTSSTDLEKPRKTPRLLAPRAFRGVTKFFGRGRQRRHTVSVHATSDQDPLIDPTGRGDIGARGDVDAHEESDDGEDADMEYSTSSTSSSPEAHRLRRHSSDNLRDLSGMPPDTVFISLRSSSQPPGMPSSPGPEMLLSPSAGLLLSPGPVVPQTPSNRLKSPTPQSSPLQPSPTPSEKYRKSQTKIEKHLGPEAQPHVLRYGP